MKLTNLIKESRLEPDQKKTFLEAVSKFSEYGKHIYSESKFTREIIENMERLMSGASNFIIDESDDWFDTITIKRDSKAIDRSAQDFTKCATEMAKMQQRLESLYEDLGHKLGRYYELSEAVDHIDDKEAATDYDDLKDKDIDNDGDTDDSDEYLHKRLGTIAKKTEGKLNEASAVSKFYKEYDKYEKAMKAIKKIIKKHTRGNIANQFEYAWKKLEFIFDEMEIVEGKANEGKISTKRLGTIAKKTEGNIKLKSLIVKEAAPRMKASSEEKNLIDLRNKIANSRKGGSGHRYGKDFDKAKTKALRAIEQMLTYTKIGI